MPRQGQCPQQMPYRKSGVCYLTTAGKIGKIHGAGSRRYLLGIPSANRSARDKGFGGHLRRRDYPA